MPIKPKRMMAGILLGLLWLAPKPGAGAGEAAPARALAGALPPEKWSQVEHSVDRALAWLAGQQAANGSFQSAAVGQPAVTSLCVMAFLSRGHQPGFGPYGQQLNQAIDFVLSCQQKDGLLCQLPPEAEFHDMRPTHTGAYNHAIAGLMLGEVYGHVTGARARNVKRAIVKALQFTRALQTRRKPYETDDGGVRYLRQKPGEVDSDLSITAWHLMFYRSARNAEFAVPQEFVDEALAYVHRCWSPAEHMFNYAATSDGGGYGASRGMTGAGILSLSLAGQHETAMARSAGDWLVAHPYRWVAEQVGSYDRCFYSTYYCSQAAAQLGGRYWAQIYPPMVEMFFRAQAGDGSFPPEAQYSDAAFGSAYTTAMAVLAMTPAYQLLPVYQR
jgi:hypothetical protein